MDSAARVLDALERAGLRLAVAESCTGGLLAAALTAVPGSSRAFLGGVVAYADEAKAALLGVDRRLLAEHGAVSAEAARAMAAGARARLGADVAVSTTGYAGPEGDAGLVHVALCDREGAASRAFRFPGGREEVRARAVEAALGLLLARLGA